MEPKHEEVEGAKIERLKAEVLERFRQGQTWAMGNRESNSLVYYDPGVWPPVYRLEEEDLCGSSAYCLGSDAALLERLHGWTEKSWRPQTETAIWEEILGVMERSPIKRIQPAEPPPPPLDCRERFDAYRLCYDFVQPLLHSEEDVQRALQALRTLYAHHFGYSDRHLDRQAVIPVVMQLALRHLKTLDDLLLLCAELPRIIEALPEESQASPIGHLHSYDVAEVKARALWARDMAELVSGGPIAVARPEGDGA